VGGKKRISSLGKDCSAWREQKKMVTLGKKQKGRVVKEAIKVCLMIKNEKRKRGNKLLPFHLPDQEGN